MCCTRAVARSPIKIFAGKDLSTLLFMLISHKEFFVSGKWNFYLILFGHLIYSLTLEMLLSTCYKRIRMKMLKWLWKHVNFGEFLIAGSLSE